MQRLIKAARDKLPKEVREDHRFYPTKRTKSFGSL